MNVLMISPGYPAEMPRFTRGLASVGARVVGLSDQPSGVLPSDLKRALAGHIQVADLWNEPAVVGEVLERSRRIAFDRVECLWEPGMMLAARLREALSLPGLNVAQTTLFRDKEQMKVRLDQVGVRTPRHASTRTVEGAIAAVRDIGFPLIVKPVSGGGSADTYRVSDLDELKRVLPQLRHVAEVSVEEFIDGEEFTYDTVCAGGNVLYENICWYKPTPLLEKTYEHLSPQTISLRQVDAPELAAGREMGRQVLRAFEFDTGFTHMEWFRKADGEVVFGEIGARPPGARMVDIMNFASDIDLYRGWAEAVCHGRLSQPVERLYNAAMITKRARGNGRIRRIEGLDELRAELGERLVAVELLPIGSPRRNWKMTSVADGYLIVRDPDLKTTLELSNRVGERLQLYAG